MLLPDGAEGMDESQGQRGSGGEATEFFDHAFQNHQKVNLFLGNKIAWVAVLAGGGFL
jgi:hypothetical protein